jgi:general secretion pathway protein D
VRYLPSSQVEKELDEMLGLGKGKADASAAGSSLHVARIVAIERPNAIVVVGTRASYERIGELLDALDVAPSNEMRVQVVLLQNADAKKIVAPINEALGGGAGAATGRPASAGASASASAPAAAFEAKVTVSADETTNALIVSATARDFLYVREVIRALDRPKRQVFIEAAILEVSADRGLDFGVAWHGGKADPVTINGQNGTATSYGGFRAMSSAGPPSATDLQAFALGVRGPDIPFAGIIPGVSTIPSFGAFLRAVATTQGSDILSTPSVIASDNTPAELKVQLQTSLQPNAPSPSLLTSIPGAATAAAGLGLGVPSTGSVAANYRGIGPRVKVTPHLNESNEVRLDVDETISDIQSAPAPGDTFGTVSYVERSATTTLTVQDGHTVVIGGLMRNRTARTETKVPILGDVPILGALFRSRSDKLEKSNLILVLTPHIVRDDQDMKRIFQRKMDERQELIDHDALFDPQEWSPPKDWAKNRGLLGEIRANVRAVEARRRELAAPPPAPEPIAPTPIELPVPQGSAAPSSSTATTPATPPAKPRPAPEN